MRTGCTTGHPMSSYVSWSMASWPRLHRFALPQPFKSFRSYAVDPLLGFVEPGWVPKGLSPASKYPSGGSSATPLAKGLPRKP